jgi:hypothetical protein
MDRNQWIEAYEDNSVTVQVIEIVGSPVLIRGITIIPQDQVLAPQAKEILTKCGFNPDGNIHQTHYGNSLVSFERKDGTTY